MPRPQIPELTPIDDPTRADSGIAEIKPEAPADEQAALLNDLKNLDDRHFLAALSEFRPETGDDLTEEQTQWFVGRAIQAAERLAYTDDGKPDYAQLERLLLHLPFFSPEIRGGSEQTIVDFTLKALAQNIENGQHLQASSILLNSILSEAALANPKILFESLEKCVWRPQGDLSTDDRSTLSNLQTSITHHLVYTASFSPLLREYIAKKLSDGAETDFQGAAKTLELVSAISDAAGMNWAAQGKVQLDRAIANLAENSQNYLLQKRAQILLAKISSGDSDIPQIEPDIAGKHEIAPGITGIYNQNGTIEQFYYGTVADEAGQEQIRDFAELNPFVPRRDLLPAQQEQRLADIGDFQFLMNPRFRQIIEQDLGINLSDYDLATQQYFLNFLKNRSSDEVGNLAPLIQEYSRDFLPSFLAIEYGAHWGNRIVETANLLGRERSAAFFSGFRKIIDAAGNLGQSVKGLSDLSEIPLASANIGQETSEAILRKSKDFIEAATFLPFSKGEIERGQDNPVPRNPDNSHDELDLDQLLGSMHEFAFVLTETAKAIDAKGTSHKVTGRQQRQKAGFTTWTLQPDQVGQDPLANYQLSLTVRPQSALTYVNDERTKQKRPVIAHAGIRATFSWPDSRKFGLRLDLDPYHKDEQFPEGKLTLDIGSRKSQIANILDRVSPDGGHHSTESFSPELSRPAVFAELCRKLDDHLENLAGPATS